ncbi:MAG: CYTH domain-containing protein [Gammaproteobacteria bacterium]|nr:CYTH domain-containing protein [Gammaproteobacteria bacterium]
MGKEIERKFLVKGDTWRELAEGTHYRQGYLSTVKERTVRVRTINDQGYLTVKGISKGIARAEYEYEIPLGDANAMLDDLCERPLIEKTRRKIQHAGFIWEVDEFSGENQGLIIAEVELKDENQAFEKPDWIGKEVSDDARYFNANLIRNPYSKWGEKA